MSRYIIPLGCKRPFIHLPQFRSIFFTCNWWVLCPGLLPHHFSLPSSLGAWLEPRTMAAAGGRKGSNKQLLSAYYIPGFGGGAVHAGSHLIHSQQSLLFSQLTDLNHIFQVKHTDMLETKSIFSVLTTPTLDPTPSSLILWEPLHRWLSLEFFSKPFHAPLPPESSDWSTNQDFCTAQKYSLASFACSLLFSKEQNQPC